MWTYYMMLSIQDRQRRYEEAIAAVFGPEPTLREVFDPSGYQWSMTLHWRRCETCGEPLAGDTHETIEHCPRCCNCYECGESQF